MVTNDVKRWVVTVSRPNQPMMVVTAYDGATHMTADARCEDYEPQVFTESEAQAVVDAITWPGDSVSMMHLAYFNARHRQ